ncbi:hypothetical protein H2200_010083 [Cladophialophora chaetospira]|uniref:Cell wall mannoprotein PIR1-like C-terminal domain-containing protein n=1 Tax=Cladophialophora chaetospira TaxID=386627 RepID=A0AA38X251_9EURO|nr:hypothetical protein H2200_010083 [Cladophialophora chaetospira]
MRFSLAILSLATSVWAQAVTQLIVPSSTPPAGCLNSLPGSFSITIVNVTTNYNGSVSSPAPSRRWDHVRRDMKGLAPRQESGVLMLTLTGGVLKDQANRTGYIASNYQFQFDGPPQAGAIYTAGFGICANGTLSLGGSAIFWQCLSGSFYNLYDRGWAEHCVPVYIESLMSVGSAYSTTPPGPESTGPDQNTIANGGGTQLSSTATFGATFGATSGGSTATASSESNTASTTSGSESATGGSSSATASATGSSSSNGAMKLMSVPQQAFAWAAGIIGAVALA